MAIITLPKIFDSACFENFKRRFEKCPYDEDIYIDAQHVERISMTGFHYLIAAAVSAKARSTVLSVGGCHASFMQHAKALNIDGFLSFTEEV